MLEDWKPMLFLYSILYRCVILLDYSKKILSANNVLSKNEDEKNNKVLFILEHPGK